jgi:hypothetical protein
MNFTLSNNVRISYVSCNFKKTKTTAKLFKKSRNMHRSNSCVMVSSVKSALMLLPFLTVVQHESGTRINIFVYYNKNLSNQCSLTAQDKCIYCPSWANGGIIP